MKRLGKVSKRPLNEFYPVIEKLRKTSKKIIF